MEPGHELYGRAGRAWMLAAAALLGMATAAAAAPSYTQSLTLVEGWNAVYFEVAPEPSTPAGVFAGLPVLGVYTPSESATAGASEFIQDPSEDLVKDPGWRWWFPDAPQSMLTNLYAILPNHAYLVHLGPVPGGTATLTVTGAPRLEPIAWKPGEYTLSGLPVDPTALPTFAQFFAASPAHAPLSLYRLVNGSWTLAAGTDHPREGEAYYVYTKGSSSYTGTFELELDGRQSLDYGRVTEVLRTNMKPLVGAALHLSLLPAASPVVLASRSLDTGLGSFVWADMPASLTVAAPAPGTQVQAQLAVRRDQFTADEVASVLEITDGAGTRRLVPVTAEVTSPAAAQGSPSIAAFPGLWVGSVSVDKVSQTQTGASTTPVPTSKPFQFRLLVHVDHDDQARLLKQVIWMWQDGATDPNGVTTPGRSVLLTDEALIPNFTGVSVRDGVPVGQRMSSAVFDFAGNDLPLSGSLGPGSTLTATISMPADFPTNPFRHPYNPDHDNLAPDGSPTTDEVLSVTRQIELEFDTASSSLTHPPEFGVSLLEGTYRETVTGLHRNAIHAEGRFQLRNVSLVEVLNQ